MDSDLYVKTLVEGAAEEALVPVALPGNEDYVVSVSEKGVRFRSYRDGSIIEMSPESSVDAQKALGADIIIPLDELPAFHTHRQKL